MHVVKRITLFLFFFFITYSTIFAVQKGSDSAISIEPYFVFPSSDTDNQMLTFGYFKNGFGLQDATTSCTFGSIFPVSNQVSLHGGKLYLDKDLIFQNPTYLATPGAIFGQNHMLDFCQSITGIPTTFPVRLDNLALVLNADLAISGTVSITGNCLVDGRWNNLVLNQDANIIVGHDATFELRNIELTGISNNQLRCLDHSGRIVLNNIRWAQDGDYTFTSGSITFIDDVNCVGPYTFIYDSPLTSTINSDSSWRLSDVAELRMGRKNGFVGREPLYFTDETSVLNLQNCTMNVTSSGMQLTNGTVLIDGEVKFDVDSTHSHGGLHLGNGNIANDIMFQLYPGAVVNLTKGHLINDLITMQNFLAGNVSKKFVRQADDTFFYSNQNMEFSNVDILAESTGITVVTPGKFITFDNCFIGASQVDFFVTGTRVDAFSYLLDGDGLISISKGALPAQITLQKSGNLIRGNGDLSGPITIAHGGTDVTFNLDGNILDDIDMQGGIIMLDHDLRFGKDVRITGSGTVDLDTYDLCIRLQDTVWTSTTVWDGNTAKINLTSDCYLASPWTIKGNCVINGNGNELRMLSGSNIVVAPDSTLKFKNVVLSKVAGNNVRCNDDSSNIIFDDTNVIFSGEYSFTTGSMKFFNGVQFSGLYTMSYQSVLTSTIAANSLWRISDGMRLVVGRQNSVFNREPLYMEDRSSIFEIDGSTLATTPYGMRLTRGTLWVSKIMSAEVNSTSSTSGLIFGDRTEANDMQCLWSPSAIARFLKGHFVYEVTVPTNFQPKVAGAKMQIVPGGSLYVNESLTLADLGIDVTSLGWTLVIEAGKALNYQNTTFTLPGIQFSVTGNRFSATTTLLDGNKSLVSTTGVIPFITLVRGTGNSLSGFGGVGAPVILQDANATLDFGIGTAMASNITLNGGKVTVSKPILFADDVMFTTSGTVSMNTRFINIGGASLRSTSTLYWDTSGAYIFLRSNIGLDAKWTFSGNCTIAGVTGSGNAIDFSAAGCIELERGARVTFRGLKLSGLRPESIYCKDGAGKIVFDDVVWEQRPESTYTFSLGRFEALNKMLMKGMNAIFGYQSIEQSTIKNNAELTLDSSFTLSYAPPVALRDRLLLETSLSSIFMDSASLLSTATGIQLTKGNLKIRGNCTLGGEAAYEEEGIIFGDGQNAANDIKVTILTGSILELQTGALIYNNVDLESLHMLNNQSIMRATAGTIFDIEQTLDLGKGRLQLSKGAIFELAPGKDIIGSVEFFD